MLPYARNMRHGPVEPNAGIDNSTIGRRVAAKVETGSRKALLVPASYVTSRYGIDYVTVLAKDGSAAQVQAGPRSVGGADAPYRVYTTAHDRELRAWYEEQDRNFWLGVLRRAAEKWFMLLPDCPGCTGCERCQLAECLAYTDPATGADGVDLAALEREAA